MDASSAMPTATAAPLAERLDQKAIDALDAQFGGEGVTLTVTRDIRGQLSVKVHAEGISREEAAQRANQLLGLILQQVAYRDVVKTMKQRGLQVQEEARLQDGTVRVRLGRR